MGIFTKKINYGDTPPSPTLGPEKPVNPFMLTGTKPSISSVGTSTNTQSTTPSGGIMNGLIRTANAGQAARSPEMNVKQPTNALSPQQSAQPPASSTGSYQGGQAVPAVGSPEYNQSVYNSQKYNQPQPQPQQQPEEPKNNGLYGRLIGGLASYGQGNDSPDIVRERNAVADLQKNNAEQQARISMNPNYLGDTKAGLGRIVNDQYLQNLGAHQGLLKSAIDTQGQRIGALGTAAEGARPVQVPYSNQYVDPTNGQGVGGNSGSLNDAVSRVVSNLTSGKMTYDEASQALSGYGQGGMNALQQALPPGFNINQSNTLGARQGAINPAFQLAKGAFDNLEQSMNELGYFQKSNVPLANDVTRGFSSITGVGSEATRKLAGAVAEARRAYADLLAAGGSGNPLEYTNQANAAIPDSPTPNDIAAAKRNLETLGGIKANIYGNAGQAGNTSQGTTQAGGYSFVQDAQGNWVPQ